MGLLGLRGSLLDKFLCLQQLVRLDLSLAIHPLNSGLSFRDVDLSLFNLTGALLKNDILLLDGTFDKLDLLCSLLCLFLCLSCHHLSILEVCLELIIPLLELLDLFEAFALSRSLRLLHFVKLD